MKHSARSLKVLAVSCLCGICLYLPVSAAGKAEMNEETGKRVSAQAIQT